MSILDRFFKRPSREEVGYTITNTPNQNTDVALINSRSYLEQYEGWTYKVVDLKSTSILSYPPQLRKVTRGDSNEYYTPENNKLLYDLHSFNPFLSYDEARKLVVQHLDLAGVAYWLIVRSDDPKHNYEFYPLDPNRVSLETDRFGLPKDYIYTEVGGEKQRISPQELVVFKRPDPRNWLKGYSPLQAARYYHNTLELGAKHNQNTIANRNVPEGFLVFPGIGENERTALEQRISQKFRGPDNAGRQSVVNVEPKFIKTGETNKDMDYIEGMRFSRDTLLSIFGVPKSLVGLDDSTYENAKQALRIFQTYTLKPLLLLEAASLNNALTPLYKMEGVAKFEITNPVESDMELLGDLSSLLYRDGVLTLNEARELMGQKPVDGGDSYRSDATNTDSGELKSSKKKVLIRY